MSALTSCKVRFFFVYLNCSLPTFPPIFFSRSISRKEYAKNTETISDSFILQTYLVRFFALNANINHQKHWQISPNSNNIGECSQYKRNTIVYRLFSVISRGSEQHGQSCSFKYSARQLCKKKPKDSAVTFSHTKKNNLYIFKAFNGNFTLAILAFTPDFTAFCLSLF